MKINMKRRETLMKLFSGNNSKNGNYFLAENLIFKKVTELTGNGSKQIKDLVTDVQKVCVMRIACTISKANYKLYPSVIVYFRMVEGKNTMFFRVKNLNGDQSTC